MKLIHRLEPFWWILFGAGGFAAAMFLPALLFGIGIAAPQGWFSEYAISYHRMYALASSLVGRVLLFAIISLTLWHSAHHLRHFALDMGLQKHAALVSYGLYSLALAATAWTCAIIVTL